MFELSWCFVLVMCISCFLRVKGLMQFLSFGCVSGLQMQKNCMFFGVQLSLIVFKLGMLCRKGGYVRQLRVSIVQGFLVVSEWMFIVLFLLLMIVMLGKILLMFGVLVMCLFSGLRLGGNLDLFCVVVMFVRVRVLRVVVMSFVCMQ